MQSIGEILATRHYSQEFKMREKKSILETFYKDRAELEFIGIIKSLREINDPKMVQSELVMLNEDMKSDRCPEFLRETFERHYMNVNALLST